MDDLSSFKVDKVEGFDGLERSRAEYLTVGEHHLAEYGDLSFGKGDEIVYAFSINVSENDIIFAGKKGSSEFTDEGSEWVKVETFEGEENRTDREAIRNLMIGAVEEGEIDQDYAPEQPGLGHIIFWEDEY